ncbi:mtDNA inheritance, partitioning of the mitochondrial organelle [Ophidiomyces ophidiicola]|nr:mtDNA inheritance, partitioning of the mitochondrial organelle [Ophidiomyces ophidiicola]KAI1989186.1 mtDNA inheritance, partitioning of the mitochondrial organelle [Ophidiomyces ophidiicola]KAI1996739.1 mtDNA inheritance, partitioning of the mitochondrial organelle [Ophidiomyces ophidiicola]KAI2003772.1 mtDNA inheritance, partitioning of the mitochondrial organelle [Ophidiomyces ophidiicola]
MSRSGTAFQDSTNQANFSQESYFTYSDQETSPVDHDISFRPGLGADGSETFTPRTIIYDLKGGFGSLRQYNSLYEPDDGHGLPRSLWDGNEATHKQPAIPQNEYQKCLELGLPPPKLTAETVRYWSDFNRLFYHPKSIVQLNEYDINSQLLPFEDWSLGEGLFSNLDREYDLLDRDFRPFAEECDQLRGIQVFTGTDDAWGGFAARYIDRLSDEFGKKNIWVWALDNGTRVDKAQQLLRAKNSARSISNMANQVTAYVPILTPPFKTPRYVNFACQSEWYFSAVTSMAVESVTLPTRLRWYDGLESWLFENASPQRIFALGATIQIEGTEPGFANQSTRNNCISLKDDDANDAEQSELSLDLNFSSIGPADRHNGDEHVFHQVRVVRNSQEDKGQPHQRQVGQNLTVQRLMQHHGHAPSIFSNFESSLEFPILDSFPSDLIRNQSRTGSTLSVEVALSATSTIGKQIDALRETIGKRTKVEEREDLLNGLSELSEMYQAHWEDDSDYGDD